MKGLKRLLVLFVTVAMMMTMCLPMMANAATEKVPATGTNQDTGTITIKGVESGVTVKAYPIVVATYSRQNDNFTGYRVVNKYSIANIEAPTAEELATIADTILADKHAFGIDLTEGKDTAENVIYTADSVDVGMYIVLVTGAESTVYNPAVVSVNYVNEDGKTVISGDTTDFGESKIKTASGEATVKKSTVPEVNKVITDATNKTDDGKGSSVNIGDSVSYKVTVSPIPSYTGKYPKLNVVDTLSKGLTYNDDLVVKVGETTLVKDTDYTLTISEDGQTITVDFVVGGKYTLNKYVGKAADITYSATLNEDAIINGDNNNDVTLNYTKDSKSEGNDGDDNDKTYTYTFDIDGSTLTDKVVTKVGEGKDAEGLAGATFGLYTDKACEKVYKNKSGEKGAEVTYNNIISDAKGKLVVKGLAAGTYYLKELSAPEGYSVNTHVFEVIISAEYNEDGTLKSWSYTIDGGKVLTITHESKAVEGTGATIKNTKLSQLPSTGGMGTYIFTIVGVVIMVVAAGFLFLRRKESK